MLKKLYVTLRWAANHPANTRSKLGGAFTFVRAQLAARAVPGDVCVPFVNGSRLLIPPRMKGAAHYIWPTLAEFDEMSFVAHYLRPGDLFLDAGANIGAFTVLAGKIAGATVIAFEAAPSTFEYLRANAGLNELGAKATVTNTALGRSNGKIHFTVGLGTENFVSEQDCGVERIEVPMATLDSMVKPARPTVLKMDVEGYEEEVLAGAEQLLASPHLQAMLIERSGNATRYGKDEAPLHRHIRSLGFTPCKYLPATRTLERLPDEATGVVIIYIRDVKAAGERLQAASAYRFAGKNF